jgi:dihydrofolate reductase
MGKVIVTEFVTVDGVFEDPGGSEGTEHGAWSFAFDGGQDFFAFKGAELEAADAQLLGRVTYEEFAQAWPTRSGDPFSDKFNAMPKFVVSSTLTDPTWQNSTVIGTDLATEVPRLKKRYSGDILVNGSGRLARSLLTAGLADELRLMIFPVILGSGTRLLDGDGAGYAKLTLAESRPIGSDGIYLQVYRAVG